MIYVLDTNAISDIVKQNKSLREHLRRARTRNDRLCLCQPVYYELMRGLFRTNATTQINVLRNQLLPQFEWIEFIDADWLQAAHFWAEATRKGRQLNDVDLFVAAITHRLNATIVSADADFDALPIKRENWRQS